MSPEARQDVVAVLPDRFGHNHRGVRIQTAEDLNPHLLANQ